MYQIIGNFRSNFSQNIEKKKKITTIVIIRITSRKKKYGWISFFERITSINEQHRGEKDNARTSKGRPTKNSSSVEAYPRSGRSPDQTVHRSPSLKFTFKRNEPNELYSPLKAKGERTR